MLHWLDSCAIYRGVLVAQGWSECGTPTVLYQGEVVLAAAAGRSRPDVAAVHGEHARAWGFRVSAILSNDDVVDHDAVSLLFRDGTRVDAPGRKFRSPGNADFGRMLERFTTYSEPGHKVLEIGSRARSGNSYRRLVHEAASYTGLDVKEGPNVDVVGDAHHLSRHVPTGFDAVFSISVFEHLIMPWMTALEMNKIMKVGALAYIQSHAALPLHEQPWDFWRFSRDAWDGLFNSHTGFRMIDKGYAMRCLIVPDFAEGGHMQGLDTAPNYLLSACLIEKIAEPEVRWEADAGSIYDLAYTHA